ncbi:MAG: gamma-glutamylcyclotransferase [Gammaproteobacteria bacterium]|nr:gamma-glutamylcyclotransferase [Gammaproteobacteria bacterium]
MVNEAVWIFGYGSLIWRPDFPYLDARRAYVDGWSRRFWQGSHDHRGTETDPGRVVTLIEVPTERCYGRAYLIEWDVFDHLDHREKNGYERQDVEIFFSDGSEGSEAGIAYIGEPGNFAWLGDASLKDIAAHIRHSAGPSGTNLDYLRELANALRALDVADPHVFELERLVAD